MTLPERELNVGSGEPPGDNEEPLPSGRMEGVIALTVLAVVLLTTGLIAHLNRALIERSRLIPDIIEIDARAAGSPETSVVAHLEWSDENAPQPASALRPEVLLDGLVVPTDDRGIEVFRIPAGSGWKADPLRLEFRVQQTVPAGTHRGVLRFTAVPKLGTMDVSFPVTVEIPGFVQLWRPLLVWCFGAGLMLFVLWAFLLHMFPSSSGTLVLRSYRARLAPVEVLLPMSGSLWSRIRGWLAPWTRANVEVGHFLRRGEVGDAAALLEDAHVEFMRLAPMDKILVCIQLDRPGRFSQLDRMAPRSLPYAGPKTRASPQQLVYLESESPWILAENAASGLQGCAFRWIPS